MKNYIAALVISVAVFIAGMMFVKPIQQVTNQTLGAFPGVDSVNDALGQQIATGACTSATSTVFKVKNPLGATSTVSIAVKATVNSATTTDFLVGTSTTGFVNHGGVTATSTMSKSLVALGSLAANAVIDVFSGQTAAMAARAGETVSSNTVYPATAREVMVGPNDWIVGFATTTLRVDPVIVAGTEPISSCSYRALFRKAP